MDGPRSSKAQNYLRKMMITRKQIVAGAGGVAAFATAGVAAAQGSNLPTQARNRTMQITRNGSRPPTKGAAQYFTGAVRVDPMFESGDPARVSGGHVTFEPGARSAWHTHPLGQTLIVTSGLGWAQAEGGPHRGDPTRRCRLVSAGTEALAWSDAGDRHDPHSHHGISERQECRLAGEGHRPAICEVKAQAALLSRDRQEMTNSLSARDRSVVTLAALIARNQTVEMAFYLNCALDNGVKPAEISETITHLAFYSGWANAMSAVSVAKGVFAARKIGTDQLPSATPKLLSLDEAGEKQRATRVGEQFGTVSPGVVQYTTDALFRDLWLRPDLAPRDRSLVTVSALVAAGQVAQIPYHLGRAMDNGMTKEQAGEVLTHLAFYVG